MENDGEIEGYQLVKVPAPVTGLLSSELVEEDDNFLFIDTDREVSVNYNYYHSHFDMFSGG